MTGFPENGAGGDDPRTPPPDVARRLGQIAHELQRGATPPAVTVREFLSWFGASRRGYLVVRRLRAELDAAGLTTAPDFEGAHIDDRIAFTPAEALVERPTPPADDSAVELPIEELLTATLSDPTYRLSRLRTARGLISVAPGESLRRATTLMLARDFSQMPVIAEGHRLMGVVTWRSIGTRWALGVEGRTVDQFAEEATVLRDDQSLFAAVPLIIERDFVLVRNAETREITGIVTATDLSEQFQRLSEPFLLLGEIEARLRRLVHNKYTQQEIDAAVGGKPGKVTSVDGMTFGNHVHLLKDSARWRKLGLDVDRETFVAETDAVRDVRNRVMHFDPDGADETDLLTLRRFTQFLQILQALAR